MDHLHLSGAPATSANTPKTCSNCGAPVITTAPRRSLRDRLLEKTTPGQGSCIIWTGYVGKGGYGTIKSGGRYGKTLGVHRAAYEFFVAPVPEGMVVDHTCHNRDETCAGGPGCMHRRCVNPAHLEAVVPRENSHRSPAHAANQEFCGSGHMFNAANTYRRPDGARGCRKCHAERVRKYRARLAVTPAGITGSIKAVAR